MFEEFYLLNGFVVYHGECGVFYSKGMNPNWSRGCENAKKNNN